MRMKIFLQLGMNCLKGYLSVRGLNTTGRKIKLVALASAAFEMELPIIASLEEQQKKLKLDDENRLQKFKICDPPSIEPSKIIDYILEWPHIDTGVVFAYILKLKDCNLEHSLLLLVDTKKPTHILTVALLAAFLYANLLVVEIKSFYIIKFSLLLKFQITNVVDIGTKRIIRDTSKPQL